MDEPSALSANVLGLENTLGALNPSQILYLEQQEQRLYVELIQILRDRDMGWLRPLCLCQPIPSDSTLSDAWNSSSSGALVKISSSPDALAPCKQITVEGILFNLIDMRQSSDLLWPLAQCNIVMDMEAIPILTSLNPDPPSVQAAENARRSLNRFMKNVWQRPSNLTE